MSVQEIVRSFDSTEDKILNLDKFFNFTPQNERHSIERTIKVLEILDGKWNIPGMTTGKNVNMTSEEKETLLHYLYEQKLTNTQEKKNTLKP